MTGLRLSAAKALTQDVSIDQERKFGDRRGSDTPVVQTVNYADSRSGGAYLWPARQCPRNQSLWAQGGV